ncbi:ABC transporter permease [Acidisoma cellulosilytica]|uniref:ABC transporter permease n=1 Tax=Acidisoma cellulosilyticum TaxID=2802395 RepID=A0A963Z623_9PROT|nr:ABC transporter permease [Acidisoma cellulosilyticum]MCB8882725.1 ABC transporter permease [Acidisoma cellulosilyticum]
MKAEAPKGRFAGFLLTAPLALLLLLVFVAPILVMLPTSFKIYDPGVGIQPGWTLHNYTQILADPYFREVLGRTLVMGISVTVFCVLFGYPLAILVARSDGMMRSLLTLLVIFPLTLNLVVRSFGWIALLSNRGIINQIMLDLGLVEFPVRMMFNLTGLIIGLTHIFLPFMVMILVASLRAMPRDVEAASAALGARPSITFLTVTLPLTAPGIFAGSVLVFILSISALVTPRLLGGPAYKVMATAIYDEFLSTLDWPTGAALAFALTLVVLVILGGAGYLTRRWTAAR